MEARSADIARRGAEEAGCPAGWIGFDVMLAARIQRESAALTTQIKGEIIPADKPGCLSMAIREPVGVLGLGGIWVIDGSRAAIATMSSETYSSVTFYGPSVIPLLDLMGNVAGAAGYSQRLYEAAHAWVGAHSTVMGCEAFAAVSGSSVATAVTIGKSSQVWALTRFGLASSR